MLPTFGGRPKGRSQALADRGLMLAFRSYTPARGDVRHPGEGAATPMLRRARTYPQRQASSHSRWWRGRGPARECSKLCPHSRH